LLMPPFIFKKLNTRDLANDSQQCAGHQSPTRPTDTRLLLDEREPMANQGGRNAQMQELASGQCTIACGQRALSRIASVCRKACALMPHCGDRLLACRGSVRSNVKRYVPPHTGRLDPDTSRPFTVCAILTPNSSLRCR
jgi:hypothetical protein